MRRWTQAWHKAWQTDPRSIMVGVALAVIGALIGLLLALTVKGDTLVTRVDRGIQAWAHSRALSDQQHRQWVVAIMIGLGRLFSTLYVVIAIALLTILYLRKYLFGLLVILLVLLPGDLIHIAVQALVDRPRPPDAIIPTPFTSFPSGHMMTTVFFIGWLTWLIFGHLERSTARLLLVVDAVLLSLLSGWSRIYLGVHWFSDILAGIALAGGWLAPVLGVAHALQRAGLPKPRTWVVSGVELRTRG